MGFLRKVGKKIKNGVKKLFGSKFGKILGGIGLSMIFWGGASSLFSGQGWWKGVGETIKGMNPFANPDLSSTVQQVGEAATDTVVGTGADTLKSEALAGAAESVKTGIGSSSTRTLTDIPFSELDLGQKVAKVGVETAEFLTPASPKEFAGDITKGALTALAVQAAQGTPVDEGGYGAVQPNIGGEPPQSAILAEVQNQIPQMTNVNTFQDLNRQVLYGTLDPHFLANFSNTG